MSDCRTMSRDFLREFIELYRAQPCLWQTKSSEYLDRNKKNEAYNLLVEKLKTVQPNATKNTVINKINTLRGGFRREYKKVYNSKKSGAGTDDIYVPSLWYYELLQFVRDQEIPRESTSNMPSDDEDEFDEDSQFDNNEGNIAESEQQIDENSGTETQVHSEHSLLSPSSSSRATTSDEHHSTLLKRQATPSSLNKKSNKRKTTSIDKADQILDIVGERLRHPEDEFTIIGRNIAFKLRRLPRESKLYAEKLINDVLFQAELGELNKCTKITSENNAVPQVLTDLQPLKSQPQSNNWYPSVPNSNYQLNNFQKPNSAATYYAGYNPLHEVHDS